MNTLTALAFTALVGATAVGCAHKPAAKTETTPAAAPAAPAAPATAAPAAAPVSPPPPN